MLNLGVGSVLAQYQGELLKAFGASLEAGYGESWVFEGAFEVSDIDPWACEHDRH